MTDTSQEIYVYIVPAERRNGDEPSCRVLIKGNTHPQQIRGTAENYIKYLMKSMVSTTGKEGACHALHEGAKTSRGKVWELPNGQFLSPVQILAEKGGTGYVSLGEIVGVYAEQGIGVIQFCGESVTLKTAMKVKGLYDCISKASRRYLEGHKDSDVVLRFIGEKEKQEMQDARDPEGAEKETALQKSLLLGSIDFIHQCPPEDQSRIIDDVYKFLWRSHMRGQKYDSGTINYIKDRYSDRGSIPGKRSVSEADDTGRRKKSRIARAASRKTASLGRNRPFLRNASGQTCGRRWRGAKILACDQPEGPEERDISCGDLFGYHAGCTEHRQRGLLLAGPHPGRAEIANGRKYSKSDANVRNALSLHARAVEVSGSFGNCTERVAGSRTDGKTNAADPFADSDQRSLQNAGPGSALPREGDYFAGLANARSGVHDACHIQSFAAQHFDGNDTAHAPRLGTRAARRA